MRKQFVKITCSILIAFMIVFNVSTDAYRGVMSVKGAGVALTTCIALAETLLLSLGLTCVFTEDLEAVGSDLKTMLEKGSSAEYSEEYAEYAELLEDLESVSYGDSVSLSKNSYNKIRSGLYSMCSKKVCSFARVVNPLATTIDRQIVSAIDKTTIAFLESTYPIDVGFYDGLYNNYSCLVALESFNIDSNSVFVMYGYESENEYSLILNDEFFGFIDNTTGGYVNMLYDQAHFDAENSVWTDTFYGDGFGHFKTGRINKAPIASNVWDSFKVLATSDFDIYSSYEEFCILNGMEVATTYSLYGSSSIAKEHVVVDDVVSIPIVEPYVTTQVQEAVVEAVAANPALTEEEINAVVVDAVATITAEKEGVEDEAGDKTVTGEITGEITDNEDINLLYDLTGIFPFCIPFDLYEAIKALSAAEKAPVFKVPINFDFVDVEYTFVWDLTEYDDLIDIVKAFETLAFVIGLMFATSKVMKW